MLFLWLAGWHVVYERSLVDKRDRFLLDGETRLELFQCLAGWLTRTHKLYERNTYPTQWCLLLLPWVDPLCVLC